MNCRSIMTLSAVALVSGGAHAADLNVPLPFPTIQDAINAAKPGDTVLIADGVYTGDGNRNLSFLGKDITVRSVNGPDNCILDCQGTPEDPYRGFSFENGETRDAVLEGLTIRNGATLPGAIADRFNGAGVLVTQQSSPTLRNLVITGSWAGCWGGAICCSFESHPLIDSCKLVDNYTNDDGGGVFAWAGSRPTILNTVITNNVSRVTGGGITTFGGAVTVINSTIAGNTALIGSGVWANNLTTFENSIIWGNDGAPNVQGSPTITHSLVGGGWSGVGNVDMAPNFVSIDDANFRLAANSPLIDRGNPDSQNHGETDADGNRRVVHDAVDMGAFEFQTDPCLADFDGTSGVDFADLVNLLGVWGTCSDCPQDLDRNGAVDFGDLVTLLGQFGPCP